LNRTTFGLDLAKRVFQVHSVDAETGEGSRETLKRSRVAVQRGLELLLRTMEDSCIEHAPKLFAQLRRSESQFAALGSKPAD
jgi:hypothetical protein